MKVCKTCGKEIDTPDGINECPICENANNTIRHQRKLLSKDIEEVYNTLGLTKVKGDLGGVYWE